MKATKLLAVILSLGIVASSAGCGNTQTAGQTQSAGTSSGEKQIRIGFSNASISNGWRVKMRDLLVEECKKRNIELIETDANDDANKQNSDIESLLQKNLDAILIAPSVEDAVNPGIEKAYDSGIPVILFDRKCSTDKYTTFVTYPDKECGIATAEMMVEGLIKKNGAPKGNLIALDTMAGSSTDRLIKEGWDEVLQKYPDIKIIGRQYTDFERSKAKDFMDDSLMKFPSGQIDGILSQDGGVTMGALEAIEEAGRTSDHIVITNVDGSNGVCKAIKDGTVYGLAQFPARCSIDALDIALECLKGNTPSEKQINKEVVRVTIDNVDDYYLPDGKETDYTM